MIWLMNITMSRYYDNHKIKSIMNFDKNDLSSAIRVAYLLSCVTRTLISVQENLRLLKYVS